MKTANKFLSAALALSMCASMQVSAAEEPLYQYSEMYNTVICNSFPYHQRSYVESDPLPSIFTEAGVPVLEWCHLMEYTFSVDENNTLTITGGLNKTYTDEAFEIYSEWSEPLYFGGFAVNSDSAVKLNGRDMANGHSLIQFPESKDNMMNCTTGAKWWRTSFTIDVTPDSNVISSEEPLFTIEVENWDESPVLLGAKLYGLEEYPDGQKHFTEISGHENLPNIWSKDGVYLSEEEYQKRLAQDEYTYYDYILLTEQDLTCWSEPSVIVDEPMRISSLGENGIGYLLGSDTYVEDDIAYYFQFYSGSSFDITAIAANDMTMNGMYINLGSLGVSSVDYDTSDIYVSMYNLADMDEEHGWYQNDAGYQVQIGGGGICETNGGYLHAIKVGVGENTNAVIPKGTVLYNAHLEQLMCPLDYPYDHLADSKYVNRGEYFIHVSGTTYLVWYNNGCILSKKVKTGEHPLVDEMNILTASPELVSSPTGDLDGDGEVSITDAIALQRYLLGVSPLTEERFRNADLYQDGVVDIYDLAMLKRMLLADK